MGRRVHLHHAERLQERIEGGHALHAGCLIQGQRLRQAARLALAQAPVSQELGWLAAKLMPQEEELAQDGRRVTRHDLSSLRQIDELWVGGLGGWSQRRNRRYRHDLFWNPDCKGDDIQGVDVRARLFAQPHDQPKAQQQIHDFAHQQRL